MQFLVSYVDVQQLRLSFKTDTKYVQVSASSCDTQTTIRIERAWLGEDVQIVENILEDYGKGVLERSNQMLKDSSHTKLWHKRRGVIKPWDFRFSSRSILTVLIVTGAEILKPFCTIVFTRGVFSIFVLPDNEFFINRLISSRIRSSNASLSKSSAITVLLASVVLSQFATESEMFHWQTAQCFSLNGGNY